METKQQIRATSADSTESISIDKLPPIDAMDIWGEDSDCDEEENASKFYIKLWAFITILIVGAIGFRRYSSYLMKVSSSLTEERSPIPAQLNVPLDISQLSDFKNDDIRDSFDTAEENFIESQTGQEFSRRKQGLFKNNAKTITAKKSPFALPNSKKIIRQWLLEQNIKSVTYRDFESYLIFNGKLFHLSEIVSEQYHLIWSDIDPIDKKIFFSDANNNQYSIHY